MSRILGALAVILVPASSRRATEAAITAAAFVPTLDAPHRVLAVVKRRAARSVTLTFDASSVVTTPEHPFAVIGAGWTRASDLAGGDLLATADGTTRLLSRVESAEEIAVYNLRVEAWSNYFVGGERVLVHNGGACVSAPASLTTQIARKQREARNVFSRLTTRRPPPVAAYSSHPSIPLKPKWPTWVDHTPQDARKLATDHGATLNFTHVQRAPTCWALVDEWALAEFKDAKAASSAELRSVWDFHQSLYDGQTDRYDALAARYEDAAMTASNESFLRNRQLLQLTPRRKLTTAETAEIERTVGPPSVSSLDRESLGSYPIKDHEAAGRVVSSQVTALMDRENLDNAIVHASIHNHAVGILASRLHGESTQSLRWTVYEPNFGEFNNISQTAFPKFFRDVMTHLYRASMKADSKVELQWLKRPKSP